MEQTYWAADCFESHVPLKCPYDQRQSRTVDVNNQYSNIIFFF
jgi:hypothetical protein